MPPRDAQATKARILRAAVAEFAEHGHAGGRVERIAREAGTNIRMIYAYFGNKDGLFDAALTSAIQSMAARVPPRPDDLPAWAGELFDYQPAPSCHAPTTTGDGPHSPHRLRDVVEASTAILRAGCRPRGGSSRATTVTGVMGH